MIGRIEPHIPRPLWRLYVLNDVIFVRRVLMNHGERAVRIRGDITRFCRAMKRR
jgi:hypothetical protein